MTEMPNEVSLDLDVSVPTLTAAAAGRGKEDAADASSIHALDGRGRYGVQWISIISNNDRMP